MRVFMSVEMSDVDAGPLHALDLSTKLARDLIDRERTASKLDDQLCQC